MSFKFSKKFLVISILIILAVGVSAMAGYHFYFQRTPQRIVRNMVVNMRNVKSFHYQTDLTMKSDVPVNSFLGGSSSGSSTQTIVSDLNLSGDFSNLKKRQFFSIFNLKLGQGSIEVSLAKGEIMGIDKVIYFRLNQLLQFGIFHLDRLENKWFRIDLNEYKQNNKVNIDYKKLLDEINKNLTLKQKKELSDLINKTNFFIITKVFPDEKINNVSAHHYAYRLNGLAFRDFLDKARDILHSNKLSPKEELQLDKGLAQLSDIKGEVWIGERDNLLYKLIVNYDFVLDHERKMNIQTKTDIELSQFNKAVNITAPEESQSLKELSNLISSLKSISSHTSSSQSTSSNFSISTSSNEQ